jgi:hypothetical protein
MEEYDALPELAIKPVSSHGVAGFAKIELRSGS